jgi:predicted  nucleic acid-binding Zn-ribbon protein
VALIDRLVQVAEVDVKRLAVKRQLAAAPAAVKEDEVKLEQAKALVQKHKDDAKKAGLELKRLEGEVKARQAEVEKAGISQNQARANTEFQALGKRIAGLKGEIGEFEMKILEEYERADARERDRLPFEKKVKELEATLKVTRDKVGAEVKRLEGELAKLEAARKDALTVLGKDELALYERALTKHGDRAVVPVLDNYCQGCLVGVRPNQLELLRSREQLVTCWECDRILYLEAK